MYNYPNTNAVRFRDGVVFASRNSSMRQKFYNEGVTFCLLVLLVSSCVVFFMKSVFFLSILSAIALAIYIFLLVRNFNRIERNRSIFPFETTEYYFALYVYGSEGAEIQDRLRAAALEIWKDKTITSDSDPVVKDFINVSKNALHFQRAKSSKRIKDMEKGKTYSESKAAGAIKEVSQYIEDQKEQEKVYNEIKALGVDELKQYLADRNIGTGDLK